MSNYRTMMQRNKICNSPRIWCVPGLLTLFLLFALPVVTHAQFDYTTSAGKITLTGYTGPDGEVIIPAKIDGLPVNAIGGLAFVNKRGLTRVTIPRGVTVIGKSSFEGCTGLASVSIPDSVISIGDSAFGECASLTSLTIPGSVTGIGQYAFASCTSLTSVTIPKSVASIGKSAFDFCSGLTSISVDALNPNYSSLDGVLFNKNQTILIQYPASKVGEYIIPPQVATILGDAFFHCANLSSITIPNGVTHIGDRAFEGCTSLTSVTIPSSVTSIGLSSFGFCTGLTNIAIPESITSVGDFPFFGCTSLTSVTIPNSFTNIVDSAFGRCTGLTNVSIPDSVTTIGYGAFLGCTSLANITIPKSVTRIEDRAFESCTRLANFKIPHGVASIGEAVFDFCNGLKEISVDVLNPNYSSLAGVLFNKNQTVLIRCPAGKSGAYVIPDTVATVGDSAFRECESLSSVTIHGGVTGIGLHAFEYCTSLSDVYFQGNPPGDVSSAFDDEAMATIYYLPTAVGWGSEFLGRPTSLWPLKVITGSNFGVQTLQFGFGITAGIDSTVVVEACNDLAHSKWTALGTNTVTAGGTSTFSDPDWMTHSTRAYRLRVQ